jgi:hypothetical protein
MFDRAKCVISIMRAVVTTTVSPLKSSWDPSVIFLPHKAKDRVRVESDLIAAAEHVHANYDFMRKYFPQFYVHKHDTYLYSNVIMAFNTP